MRRGFLVLALAFCGCADTSMLTYGRYLLDAGRYAEAYPHLEAAAARGGAAARAARDACAARWSAQLLAEARAALAAGRDAAALPLLVKAYDLAASPATIALLDAADSRLRAAEDGAAEIERLLSEENWRKALEVGLPFLAAAPHDGRLHALCREARERGREDARRRAAKLLDAGLGAEAAAVTRESDALDASLPLPQPEDPEYAARLEFPQWYGAALPWERAVDAPVPLEEALLRETTAKALETERLLARFGGALAEQRLLEAAAALAAAERAAPDAGDFRFRVRQARERLDAAADQALDATFLSGDFRRALTLFRETHFGPIPVAEERRAQFEARLRNLLAQKLKQHLGDNMAANALLLLSAARTVFPELWADSERKARFHFLARSPVIAVAGEGAEEITVWLREARLPLGDGQAVLKVDATRPELLLTESPPSVGIEEKLVPAELERRPHPARGAILAEIALAGMAPPEPGDPWERDFLRRRSAFFHERRRELARQLEALPEHAYHFGWQKARVSVVHHQVKAELRVALALGPAFGNADGPPETLAVSRSYTAQAPPGVDPYSRGYFPSKNAMRAELGALLGRKARELVLARFDAALKDMVKTAVRQAGEGDGEGAVELLAHVYAARGEGLTAGKEAEALLARAWGRANVEFLLAAPAGAFAEKPVK